ncbi:hypothetical protein FA15DRAFT_674663 [Coprinopsis marcescibilis]|uniref:LCCL domain-containing protein n=1 Tax=Coprinopsis marcescibilis TaxID=230819 RepID=A0A5C3KH62_COPMA|nr:hypothetical protein FA15DRAFT_674663 [Coprinopsis marcescibilis]
MNAESRATVPGGSDDDFSDYSSSPPHSPTYLTAPLIPPNGNANPQTFLAKAAIWIRGPRPRLSLTPPSPLLNITLPSRRETTIDLHLESHLNSILQPLQTPIPYVLVILAYTILFSLLAHVQNYNVPPRVHKKCHSTLWGPNSLCGLNGQLCMPMNTSAVWDFKCPSGCADAELVGTRLVGNEEVEYKPLVIGGGDEEGTYRADSFVCSAALHAGIISNNGGCGRIRLLSSFTNFVPSTSHGVSSIGFPSSFPLAYTFSKDSSINPCSELSTTALFFSVSASFLLFLLHPSSKRESSPSSTTSSRSPRSWSSPLTLYYPLCILGFFHVGLFSDTYGAPPSLERLFSLFLPSLFVLAAFYSISIRHTLPALLTTSPISTAILYLPAFWVGALSNLTLEKLPISRLLPSDIVKRPGGIPTFLAILGIVLACIYHQVHIIRKTGWLPFYLRGYGLGVLALLVTGVIGGFGGYTLRVHHYVLPMLYMPLTTFPTRMGAVYQGLGLGMYLNGVAAWGFDSVLQTSLSLRQDDPMNTALPTFLTTSSTYDPSIPLSQQVIKWGPVPVHSEWIGYSLLVDDVQRYVGMEREVAVGGLGTFLNKSVPHFFRLAFKSERAVGDYTKAAVLWPNGTWVDPPPGPSY